MHHKINFKTETCNVMFLPVYFHLILLAEVHIEDLGVAQRPFHTVKGGSSGNCLLSCGILQRQKKSKAGKDE